MNGNTLGKVYGDREVVVRQGEKGECMFAIQEGQLEVVRQTASGELRLGVLHKGDIFGEMSIFENKERSATVRALGEVRLLTIDKRTFLRRVQEDPSLAFNLARMLCSRIRRLNADLENLRYEGAVAPG